MWDAVMSRDERIKVNLAGLTKHTVVHRWLLRVILKRALLDDYSSAYMQNRSVGSVEDLHNFIKSRRNKGM